MKNTMNTSEIDKRLLIVDDEIGPRKSLNVIFKDEYEVFEAAGGAEAISLASKKNFPVAIVDICMPEINGIDTLRELKKINSNMEVVILTAYESLDTAMSAIKYGVSGYLKKPIDIEKIRNVVSSCLDRYSFLDNLENSVRTNIESAQRDFLHMLSHELNTPMNGIVGFIELLQDTDLDEDQRFALNSIKECSYRWLDTINDILDYSRLAYANVSTAKSIFNPHTLLINIISRKKEFNPDSNIKLILQPNFPNTILGYEYDLKSVLDKLLANAIKFNPKGNILISFMYRFISEKKIKLKFDITDSGTGIPPDDLMRNNIFKPFYQMESGNTRSYGGLGLGLAICDRLCRKMGANLKVESVANKGCCFSVSVNFELPENLN